MDDLFISHVAADKPIAQALADKLQQNDLTVTLITLGLGDSLIYRIEQGFRQAQYGALILSPDFFKKLWPRGELDKIAMIDQEFDGQTRLFPIWRQVDPDYIARYSPALARRAGVFADPDMKEATAEILERIRPEDPALAWSESLRTISTEQMSMAEPKLAAASSLNDPRYLRDVLKRYFNRSELADLSWDMGVDYEDIPGDTISAKSLGLVKYMDRRGRLDELSQQVQKRRPFILRDG